MTLPIRVLVIDDSAFMRRALVRTIEQDQRFKVVETAEDGQDGVTKALRIRPDLITLDVDMPVMNGIEALKILVAQSSIPVVMVSAQTHKGAKVTLEALEIGAVDVIPKSDGADLIHEKLGAAVSAKLGRRGGAAQVAQKPAPAAPFVKPPATSRPRLKPKLLLIGSSTGGPQALQEVIQHLPKDLSIPVVVAQHMPPQFTQALAERLDEKCPPAVSEARDGTLMARGNVYVAPGGFQMRVSADGKIKISPDKGESLYKPSVDVLAESALQAFSGNVLGVMLTGMGSDGAKEFLRLKNAGAYIIAQDQASCVVYGMPRAVAEQNGADEILPLDQIGPRLAALLAG